MSDRSEKPFELGRDGLGILLFTLGAFMTVLVALAISSSDPIEKAEGTAAIARLSAASIGLLPGLLFGAGCALVGARLFLTGDRLSGKRAIARGLGRIAIVAVGFAVLLGAFSRTAGGWIGNATAGAIARGTNVFLAALAGVTALAAAVWVAWARRTRTAGADAAPAPVGSAASSPDDGVSPEEAAELIPFDLPRSAPAPRMVSPVTRDPIPATPKEREGLRSRAAIPEGTRPLTPTHDPAPVTTGPLALSPLDDELASPALHERPADPEGLLAADRADEDLALEEESFDLVEDEEAFELVEPEAEIDLIETRAPDRATIEPEELATIEPEEFPTIEPEELATIPPEELGTILPEELATIHREELPPLEFRSEGFEPEPPSAVASPPRPSWEQPSLFDVEEEPPVDAYGTPLGETDESRKDTPRRIETASEDEMAEEEPDVVLTPVPPKRKRKKARVIEATNERSRLLAEIGCLLVERGRVAVSMLQKQYAMDFDEATRVLDDLQELGLIGPYLGGQHRDILLTRDEWLEKVSSL